MHLFLLFIGGTILTLGDIIFKYWIENNNWKFFLAGLLVGLVAVIILKLAE